MRASLCGFYSLAKIPVPLPELSGLGNIGVKYTGSVGVLREDLPDFASKGLRREGFLEVLDASVQHSPVGNHFRCVSGHENNAGLGL